VTSAYPVMWHPRASYLALRRLLAAWT
jgi:hypothetical protein